MIYIKKNTENTFILRLADKRTLPNTYFLFVLRNLFTQEVVNFILTDDSPYKDAYNLFVLEEDSVDGSTEGGVDTSLKLESGQYEYELYETLTTSLDVSDAIGDPIEKDMLIVEIVKNTDPFDIDDIYK